METEAPPAVAVDGLGRDFGERTALADVSFALATGDSLTVVGPNGAGKSTLLRILATLLRPHRGSVRVLGAELPGDAWRARGRIGLLGHEPLLYGELTIMENLRFHARLHGIAGREAEERMAALLDAVAMSHRAADRVDELSRGMAQRVGACRALLHDPELLLLDEPGSHLDPRGHDLVRPLLEGVATRVFVTHDVDADLPVAKRVLALDGRGSVFHDGPPEALDRERLTSLYAGGPA